MYNLAMMRRYWIVPVVMLGLYLLTRTANLTSLPMFTDEAIYIRWSQIGSRDANWRFISLTDGKQPLFTWIMMVYFKLIDADPLIIGRLVSVTAGCCTLIFLMMIAHTLFHHVKTTVITGFLYIFSPFAVWYDRLALYDSLVSALFVLNMYVGLLLVKYVRLDVSLIYGMTLGMGLLNKSSGLLSVFLAPVYTVFFKKSGLKWVTLLLLSAILSHMYYSVLRLSPFFHMIGLKNTVFIYTVNEWLTHPFKFFLGNIRGMTDWLMHYVSWPVIVLSIMPVVIFWKNTRQKIFLFLHFLVPYIGLALFAKVLYPRFILFMVMPLFILAADALRRLDGYMMNKRLLYPVLAILFFPLMQTSYYIVTDPIHAPIHDADRSQMIDDWPSGGGVREVVSYLEVQAKNSTITVFTDGTFGLLPYALEIYLVDHPNITIQGIWPFPADMPSEIYEKTAMSDVFIVTNQMQTIPTWPVELILEIPKGTRPDRFMRLYKVGNYFV